MASFVVAVVWVGLVYLFSDWVWSSAYIFSIFLIYCGSWFGLKQCDWLNLGSLPPRPLCLPLPPLQNTQILGFTIYSHREALASPTHYCSNLKHMQGEERKGSLWEERWKNHTHCEATIPSCLHVVKHPKREGVCWDSLQYIHTHWFKNTLVSYYLTHSDFSIDQFLDHDGGKTNKGKSLKA